MTNYLKRMGAGAFIGVSTALILKMLIPNVPGRFIIALVVFACLADIICEILEKDSALKRTSAKVAKIVVAVVAYLALRISVGHIVGMPITSDASYAAQQYGGAAQDGILEFMFLIPGAALAYGAAYGGIGRKIVIGLAFVGFFIVLWQVKQPDNARSAGLRSQSFINWTTRTNNQKAAQTTTERSWAKARSGVPRIYRVKFDDKGQLTGVTLADGLSLKDGQVVKLSSTPPVVFNDQWFTAFRLYGEAGVVGSEELWAESEALEPLEAVDYRDGQVVPAATKDGDKITERKIIELSLGECPTGIMVKKGDVFRYLDWTAPFRSKWSDKEPVPQSRKGVPFLADEDGHLVVYGEGEGALTIEIER